MNGTKVELVHSGSRADELQCYLESAAVKEGDRIPPERELADLLGISRRRLRRSLARLEAGGLIWRGVGRGTFLGPPPERNAPSKPKADVSPRQIMDARLAVEPAVAAMAAFNASSRDLDKINNCVRRNLEVQTDPEWALWDAAFHRAIAEATHNPMLIAIVESFGEARAQMEWGDLRRTLVDGDCRRRSASEHRLIFESLQRRDPELSAEAMRDHLRVVQVALFGERN